MALKYKCHNCGRSLGYDGLCYICKDEKERNEILAWTEQEISNTDVPERVNQIFEVI